MAVAWTDRALAAAVRWWPLAALVGFIAWLGPSQAGNRKWLDLGVEAMILAGAATGLNVLVGSTGLLSLGHAGFFVAGGYAGAVLGPYLLGDGSAAPEFVVRNAPWFGPVFAVAVGAGLGVALALACCHLRGFHLTVVTLAFGALVPAVVVLAADRLGGLGGRTVEHIPDTRNAFLARGHTLAGVYYTAAVFLLVALWLAWNLSRSRWGRALTAVRDAEVAARTSGIDPYRHRVAAFAMSAAVVAVAGWVSALRTLSVSSGSALDVQTESFRYVITVAVGGVGTLAGPVVGAFVLTFGLGLDVFQQHLRDKLGLVFGGLALAVVALAPAGLVGAARQAAARVARRRPEPAPPPLPVLVGKSARTSPRSADQNEPDGSVLLSVRGLTRSFGGVAALDGLDLDVVEGSVHAVIGPNGSGKSTFVNVVTGVERATGGRVLLGGSDVTDVPAHRRAALGVARTFQGVQVWSRMTVLDNVLAGAHVRGGAGLARCLLGLHRAEERRLRARAAQLLALVGLEAKAGDRAGDLTLAEQRRLELARALAAEPSLLLLDEPLAGMDGAERERLVRLVEGLRAGGLTIVLVEHHMETVLALADTVTVVHQGVKLVEGPPAVVAADALVQEAYLGPSTGADGN
ncbi:MAG: branched-chain amino acid ABC transporter ATP-binding protein/permease [Acidimicrobiales bacterium]